MAKALQVPTVVHLTMPGGKILKQKILYEDPPKFCDKCKKHGHVKDECYARSIPDETAYVPRYRLEENNKESNKMKNNRGRSRRRNRSRRRSSVSATSSMPSDAATNTMPSEDGKKSGTDQVVKSIQVAGKQIESTSGAIVPVANAFSTLRFPQNSSKDKESAEKKRERKQQEQELAKHIAEEDDDDFLSGRHPYITMVLHTLIPCNAKKKMFVNNPKFLATDICFPL